MESHQPSPQAAPPPHVIRMIQTLVRIEFLRFVAVGVLNTAVAYAVFAALLFFHVHYTAATLVGGVAGMLVGFKTTGVYVFKNPDNRRIVRFALVFVLMYGVNVGIQYVLNPFVNGYASGGFATVLTVFLSYALNRSFVFARDRAPAGGRDPAQTGKDEFGSAYAAIQIRRSRNPLRRMVRSFYLSAIVRHAVGRGIDFGCGSGDLLRLLPAGSVGLEVNPAAVAYCREHGLDVRLYSPETDQYRLQDLPEHAYGTFFISHVLEHLADPATAMRALFAACRRLGVTRIVITLPCKRGFSFDKTHKTFVDEVYLTAKGLWNCEGFSASARRYFPINAKWIGDYYTFHELRIIYDRHPGENRHD